MTSSMLFGCRLIVITRQGSSNDVNEPDVLRNVSSGAPQFYLWIYDRNFSTARDKSVKQSMSDFNNDPTASAN